MILIFFLALHHIADVAFQPSWLIENKHKHAFAIYEHSMIWAGMITFGLFMIDKATITAFFFLLIGHFTIDFFKYKLKSYNWIYLDQLLHYLQIIIILWK